MTATPSNDPALLIADHGFVRSLAQQLCRDDDTADDIAQEAMVTALREGPADGAKRRSWLASVTRHLVFNHSRASRRRKARELMAARHMTNTSPAEIVAEEQLRSTVVAAVLKLPEVFREVVLLRYYRGLDARECAQHLDVPEATVRTRLKRGIDRLRVELDKQHGGDRKQWVTALLPFALETAPATLGMRAVAIAAAILLLGTAATLPFWLDPEAPAPNASGSQASTPAPISGEAGENPGDSSTSPQPSQPERRTSRAAVAPQRVIGTVTDSKSNQALANALVTMKAVLPYEDGIPLADLGEVRTDHTGSFEFVLTPLDHLEPLTRQRIELYYRVDATGYAPVEDACGLHEMQGDGTIRLDPELYPKAVTKGRIVDKDGNPIPYANLLILSENVRYRDRAEETGYFVLHLPPKDVTDREFTLLAFDDRHGFARPVTIAVDPEHETLVPDLRVENRHGCIEGIVRDRNGRPVPDFSVRCSWGSSSDAYTVHGKRIEDIGRLMGKRFGTTDEDGRFAFRALPPGKYTIRGTDGDVPVELAAFQTKHLEFETSNATITVVCEDRQGLPWHPDYYGVYLWQGDPAYKARTEFQQTGFTRELMSTAGTADYNALSSIEPPAFAVVEATWNGIGPMTGSCFLAADQYYGEVRLRLADRQRTGSLQIVVNDANGLPCKNVIARASRAPGKQPVPITFGDPVGDAGVTSEIYPGSQMQGKWWQWVPTDGVIRNLPVGDVHLEIVVDPELQHGRVLGSRYQLIKRKVRIAANETATLTAASKTGCLPKVEIDVPEIDDEFELSYVTLDLVFIRNSDGTKFARTLMPLRGRGTPRPKDGKIEARVSHAVPPGSYTVRTNHLQLSAKSLRGKRATQHVRCPATEVVLTGSVQTIRIGLELR